MFRANRRGRSHNQARFPRGPRTSTRRGDRQAGVSLTEYDEQPRCQAYDNERTSQGMTMADAEWILLNPGPANTTPTVRRALVMPDLCHREPEFFKLMRSCRERLVRLAGGTSDWTAVVFTGSGTAAVEAALASAVPVDGGVLIVNNGVYGDRMIRICRAHDIRHHAIAYDNITPASQADVARALQQPRNLSHVAVFHHETTTGLLNPVGEIARVAAVEGRRLLVDAMSSLFGEPLDVTRDPIDFVMASANKCLQGIPGVSFVIAR